MSKPLRRWHSAILLMLLAPPLPAIADIDFSFEHYDVEVQFTNGFGISSLRYKGQQADFVASLPLADWEWLWLEAGSERNRPDDLELRVKLLEPSWDPPVLRQEPGQAAILEFSQQNVLREGLDLAVTMRFYTQEPRFDLTYTISNGTSVPLNFPYIMVGLPGFLDHAVVTAVETGDGQRREPLSPHEDFLSEALAGGRSDYLLLRHDASPIAADSLLGVAEIKEDQVTFALKAAYAPNTDIRQAYSAHTNKPLYLTSHLYLFLNNIEVGEVWGATVQYTLSKSGGDAPLTPTDVVSTTAWGDLKNHPAAASSTVPTP
jgi:hypothetical protein